MIKKYRKKPVVIESIQWNGNNFKEIKDFCNKAIIDQNSNLVIEALEGDHYAKEGDYIIKGVQGEFYPCKPDIFEQTYEEVQK